MGLLHFSGTQGKAESSELLAQLLGPASHSPKGDRNAHAEGESAEKKSGMLVAGGAAGGDAGQRPRQGGERHGGCALAHPESQEPKEAESVGHGEIRRTRERAPAQTFAQTGVFGALNGRATQEK